MEQFSYMMNYLKTVGDKYKIIIGGDYNFDFKITSILYNEQFLFKQYIDYNILNTDVEKIDNILVNKRLEQVFQYIDCDTDEEILKNYGSDHYPVISLIKSVS